MSNLNDLRSTIDDDDNDRMPAARIIDNSRGRSDGRVLGMTAAERAVLSVLLFVASLILGAGVLIVSGRIVL